MFHVRLHRWREIAQTVVNELLIANQIEQTVGQKHFLDALGVIELIAITIIKRHAVKDIGSGVVIIKRNAHLPFGFERSMEFDKRALLEVKSRCSKTQMLNA